MISKFGSWLDIRDYGTTADWGVAINWALGLSDQVWIPQGVWNISTPINIRSNQILAGVRDSVLNLRTASARINLIGGHSILEGVTIEDPLSVTDRVVIIHVSDCTVRDVFFNNLAGRGLVVDGIVGGAEVLDTLVHDCRFDSVGARAFISSQDTRRTHLKNSKFRNGGDVAITISNGSSHAIVEGNSINDNALSGIAIFEAKYCVVSNNNIQNVEWIGITAPAADNSTIVGNIIQNCGLIGIENAGGQNVTVTGNTVENVMFASGFNGAAGISSGDGNVINIPGTGVYVGNTIIGSQQYGFRMTDCGRGSIIANNRISGCASNDIRVVRSPLTMVSDNYIKVDSAHNFPIWIDSFSGNSTATDNLIDDPSNLLTGGGVFSTPGSLLINHDNVII